METEWVSGAERRYAVSLTGGRPPPHQRLRLYSIYQTRGNRSTLDWLNWGAPIRSLGPTHRTPAPFRHSAPLPGRTVRSGLHSLCPDNPHEPPPQVSGLRLVALPQHSCSGTGGLGSMEHPLMVALAHRCNLAPRQGTGESGLHQR